MKNAVELKNDLAHFSGTEGYHRLTLSRGLVFTDGVAYMAKEAGAFWLMDIIASYQPKCKNDGMLRDFQVWTLKKGKDDSAVVTCERDTNDEAFRQDIEHTDFPLDEVKLYVERGALDENTPVMVCMLPGER